MNDLADEIHSWAVGKGWWEEDNRNFGEMVALIHSECSEALEEWRDHGYDQLLYYKEDKQGNQKPEGIAIELADIIIRVLDLTASLDIDIAQALQIKMAYNETRAHRHGGKLA